MDLGEKWTIKLSSEIDVRVDELSMITVHVL